MDRFDRIYDLHKLLSSSRYPVSREKIEQELECSRATAKRIIDSMRLYLDAPIKYDRTLNGYYYDGKQDQLYELPGLWFNASELHALLSVQQLLSSVQPGLFDKQLAPLKDRISKLLNIQGNSAINEKNLQQRVKILQMASRQHSEFFQPVAGATMQRKRLKLAYLNRSRNEVSEREVSPQQLVHYRDNWYLDAWCHKRDDLRTFSLDAIREARVLDQAALEVKAEQMHEHYESAYGIFSGKADQTATLVFSEKIARWVSNENWHPDQQGKLLDDGRYQLQIPYGNPTELVMDILRYGPEVEVESPNELRTMIQQRLEKALEAYL